MADTTSIASRMEKLAKLKRMKESMTAQSPATEAKSESVVESSEPIALGQDSTPPAEQSTSLTPEISIPEDVSQTEVGLDSAADLTQQEPDTSTVPEASEDVQRDNPSDVMQDAEDPAEEPFDFDPANIRDEDLAFDAMPSADSPVIEENLAEDTSITSESEADFTMEDTEESAESTADILEATAETDDADSQFLEDIAQASASSDLDIMDEDIEMADIDDIAALAAVGGVAATATASSAAAIDEEFAQSLEDTELPDFSANEIDEELLNREFETEAVSGSSSNEPEVASNNKTEATENETDGRISISFDESRSTLLDHVSRQMGCSVDDVVVTALDWYLDALFGEENEIKSA